MIVKDVGGGAQEKFRPFWLVFSHLGVLCEEVGGYIIGTCQ